MGNHTIQTIFLTAVCLLLAALPSRGQEEEESRLELGVQLLGHGEVRNGGFNESMAEEEADDNSHAGFMMSRTRVTADFLQKGLSARVTAQHAGVWGQKGQGSLNLNEAWARLSLKNGLFAQLGRQALSYDDERIIGPNDWAMAYMTHDVLKLGYEGNGHRLHAIGLRGRGMTIAVLDGGFQNVDQIPAFYNVKIDGIRDCVWHNPKLPHPEVADHQLYYETDHGTRVLSALAANLPEVLIGTAPEAHYWLMRCEDQQSEQPVEQDYWAMAAELADSAGVDIINSSLGYNDFDEPHESLRLRDLDGNSTLISRTASMLARKGIVLVNSAGNMGMGPWKKICVPADAHQILTVGAVNEQGKNAPFSGVGPSQDGRVKPDVMALGAPAALISGRGSIVRDMGTSFSAPVVCGLVACLWQSCPHLSANDIISLVRKSSDNYATPDNVYGFGIPNFWRAYMIGKLEYEK